MEWSVTHNILWKALWNAGQFAGASWSHLVHVLFLKKTPTKKDVSQQTPHTLVPELVVLVFCLFPEASSRLLRQVSVCSKPERH